MNEIARLTAERDRAIEAAKEERQLLEAWFELSTKMESEGTQIIQASINTWLRRASNGGMPKKHADIVQNVVDEAARIYLWNALVPVLRGIQDSRAEKLREALSQIATLTNSTSDDPILINIRAKAEAALADSKDT